MAQVYHDLEIQDRYYGKKLIKIVQVERNGAVHTIKEYQMELRLSLAGVKEYTSADNRDIVCADACKDAVFILANNHGIKSPEEFGVLVCNFFLSEYSHMTKVCLMIEDFTWNRISYGDEESDDETKLHNHAFIHTPECIRTCSVTLNRGDKVPIVVSGIKDLRLIKTDKAQFIGFHNDSYRTLQDLYERVLSTNVSCTWRYKVGTINIDYDDVWKRAKNCIIKSWGGDVVEGVLSSCMQFTLQTAEKQIFNSIPEISSIEMLMPNLLYADFDFTKFQSLKTESGNRKVYVPIEKPSGLAFAKMERKDSSKQTNGSTNGTAA